MKYCIHYWHTLYLPTAPAWRGCISGDGSLTNKDSNNLQLFDTKELAERWVKRRSAWMTSVGRDVPRTLRVEEYP